MRSPSSWSRVLRLTYAAVLPLYFACGLLGYAAYGDFANANINVNFPDNLANQASIVVQMVQEVRLLRSTWPRHHARLTLTPSFTPRHSPLATRHSPLTTQPPPSPGVLPPLDQPRHHARPRAPPGARPSRLLQPPLEWLPVAGAAAPASMGGAARAALCIAQLAGPR